MALSPGTRLGPYEVLSLIGKGGMGEVYQARDRKLERDVAIKVLPEEFSQDKERLARFEREAKLLAQLNHPGIATLYGLEESGGQQFLVMELVEGETLAERIASGPIPVKEALPLFVLMAQALEAAHEKGIVHRDLKPANIKVSPDSKPKILDFGLAKAMARDVPARSLAESPTLTREGTETGVILGTAPYMSPEQARGKPVDKRTDVWAFGCVLYEALSGRAAFSGETLSDTIARILDREPDWEVLPAETPALIQRLLRRLLDKDRSRRLRDLGDAALEIEEALAGAPDQPSPHRDTRWVSSALATIALVATGIAIWSVVRTTPSPASAVSRTVVTLPHDQQLVTLGGTYPMALSPDGERLAYVALVDGERRLFVRALDQFDARPIPRTDGARFPFFSPDGQWVGFFAEGKLYRVAVQEGRPLAICDAMPRRGGAASWGPDDYIYFGPSERPGLHRVPAAGGTPEVMSSQDPEMDEQNHIWPYVLPDGRGLVSTVRQIEKSFDTSDLAVLSFETMEWRVLGPGSQAQYLEGGYLAYNAGRGELHVVPFDLDRQEVTGPPVSVLDGVYRASGDGGSFFAASRSGSLVYVRGGEDRALVRVDREGQDRPLTEDVRGFRMPAISPDGRHVAVIIDPRPSELWVYDLERGTRWKLPHEGNHVIPVWTPDGQKITFYAGGDLHWMSPDGTGEAETLLERPGEQFPYSWSPDGQFLAFGEGHPTTAGDIWVLPRDGDPFPIVATPAREGSPKFSPGGDWLTYISDESGRNEVYIRSFPEGRARHTISTTGGANPVWSADGSELYYHNRRGQVLAVSVQTEPSLRVGAPRVLFDWPYGLQHRFNISPQDDGFVMIKTDPDSDPTKFHVVLNWSEELKRLVPAGN